jgi:hypothetical protein
VASKKDIKPSKRKQNKKLTISRLPKSRDGQPLTGLFRFSRKHEISLVTEEDVATYKSFLKQAEQAKAEGNTKLYNELMEALEFWSEFNNRLIGESDSQTVEEKRAAYKVLYKGKNDILTKADSMSPEDFVKLCSKTWDSSSNEQEEYLVFLLDLQKKYSRNQ